MPRGLLKPNTVIVLHERKEQSSSFLTIVRNTIVQELSEVRED